MKFNKNKRSAEKLISPQKEITDSQELEKNLPLTPEKLDKISLTEVMQIAMPKVFPEKVKEFEFT